MCHKLELASYLPGHDSDHNCLNWMESLFYKEVYSLLVVLQVVSNGAGIGHPSGEKPGDNNYYDGHLDEDTVRQWSLWKVDA